MKAHFQKMFAYNAWANHVFIQCLKNSAVANEKIYLLISHVFNAEEVWLCRLREQEAPNQDIWKEHSFLQLQQKAIRQKEEWERFITTLDPIEFSRQIGYENSKGQKFRTEVADILTHVINHGTYHRAQVASLLRLEKITPPVSDYIAYVRLAEKDDEKAFTG